VDVYVLSAAGRRRTPVRLASLACCGCSGERHRRRDAGAWWRAAAEGEEEGERLWNLQPVTNGVARLNIADLADGRASALTKKACMATRKSWAWIGRMVG